MDKELIILEQIQNNPHVNQRDLAHIAEASLGMTNAILKRFAQKGLITIKKVNNRNIKYALTSKGFNEISRRSLGYFKRTIKNVVVYKDAICEVICRALEEGYTCVELVGESDLAFIVEHECYKQGMKFYTNEFTGDISVKASVSSDVRRFRFIAEGLECEKSAGDGGCFELKSLVMVR